MIEVKFKDDQTDRTNETYTYTYADVPIFVNICARYLHILRTSLYSGYHFVINIPARVSVSIVIRA
jgi:hypothetical protein